MKLLRKVLFYLFFALYLFLCPVIIFYAFGYILTPKGEEGFAKTGLIRVESLPENAALLIANRRYVEKTPATIRNLMAGSYDIRLSLAGYRPWVRTAEVEPGKACHLTKVLLIPQDLKTRTLIAKPFEDLQPVPGTRFLLLRGSELAGDLKVFDWRSESLRFVLPEASPFTFAKLDRIFRVRESSLVLLRLKTSRGTKFVSCSLDKDKPEVKDLSMFFPKGDPGEVLWEGNRPDCLFALYDRSLWRLDLENEKIFRGFFEKVRGFGLSRGKVYALCGASIMRSHFNAKPGDRTQIESGVSLENLFRGDEKFTIDFISNNTICFRGEEGELFSNALPYRFVGEGLRGYEPDAVGRKIVLWQKDRVGVLDFEKPERKKEFFERGPEIEWVFEKGENIRQAYFVYDASHVLFVDGDQVFLSRLGERGVLPEKLVRVKEGRSVFYAEKTGKLYYLEPARGDLVSIDILPEGLTFSGVIGEFEKETQGAVP